MPTEVEKKKYVWDNTTKYVLGKDRNKWRADLYNKIICWDVYGDTNSEYGWEIDHIKPVSKGGSDDLDNLQALHWRSNREKSDIY